MCGMWRPGVVEGLSDGCVGGFTGVRSAGSAAVAETPVDVSEPDCAIRSFIEQDPTIGPQRALLTSRAARWVTVQVGGRGRSVDEVAAELGCDWHTVNNEVGRWGEALLGADTDRIGEVGAVGIDKSRCSGGKAGGAPRFGAPLSSTWEATSRFDIVPGRTADSAASWFRSQPPEWLDGYPLGGVGHVRFVSEGV